MKYYLVLFSLIFFLGCAQKTQIKAIKASNISDSAIKYIGVIPFKNDFVSQSAQIESALDNLIINNKKFFKVIDRKNMDLILKEKKLDDSGLVDLIKDNNNIGLSQMQTFLSGKVILDDKSSSRFYANRTDYSTCIRSYTKNNKRYCSKYRQYKVRCYENLYTLKTYIKITKVSDASTLFSKTYLKQSKYTHCDDDKNILPSKKYVNTKLAKDIAQMLIKDIAPSYVYYEVELFDDLDIDIDNEQLFDNAIKLIKLKEFTKANLILQDLNYQTHSKSYVILYDLAITYEALGKLDLAYKLLEDAQMIALSDDDALEVITKALHRVKNNMLEKEKASKVL